MNNMVAILVGVTAVFATTTAAVGQNIPPEFRPQSQPKSDLQRAIENPPRPSPPPTALQKLERGEIPSSNNPMPSSGGVSVDPGVSVPQGTESRPLPPTTVPGVTVTIPTR